MEDFNIRIPREDILPSLHNNSIDSQAQEEQINQSQNRIFLPPILSEGSQPSKSSEFANSNSRNAHIANSFSKNRNNFESLSENGDRCEI